jgi:hypothetical protein
MKNKKTCFYWIKTLTMGLAFAFLGLFFAEGVSAASCIPAIEREALMDLYESTNQWGNTNPRGWGTDTCECTWEGVGCGFNSEGDKQVTILRTPAIPYKAGEINTIPTSLEDLENLRRLTIRSKGISGSLPHQVVRLENLEELVLSDTRITGYFNFSSLQPSKNKLKKLKLGVLNVSLLNLDDIGELTSLEELDLSNIYVERIPESLGNLTNLEYLRMNRSGLKGEIPASLSNLTNLKHLDFGCDNCFSNGHTKNQLKGRIPFSLSTINNMMYIKLFDSDAETNKLCVDNQNLKNAIISKHPSYSRSRPNNRIFHDLAGLCCPDNHLVVKDLNNEEVCVPAGNESGDIKPLGWYVSVSYPDRNYQNYAADKWCKVKHNDDSYERGRDPNEATDKLKLGTDSAFYNSRLWITGSGGGSWYPRPSNNEAIKQIECCKPTWTPARNTACSDEFLQQENNCNSDTQNVRGSVNCTTTTNCGSVGNRCSSGQRCSWGTCVEITTYSWEYGTWSACDGNCQQTRTAICKSSGGSVVSDSFCSGAPNTNQACSTNDSCNNGAGTCNASGTCVANSLTISSIPSQAAATEYDSNFSFDLSNYNTNNISGVTWVVAKKNDFELSDLGLSLNQNTGMITGKMKYAGVFKYDVKMQKTGFNDSNTVELVIVSRLKAENTLEAFTGKLPVGLTNYIDTYGYVYGVKSNAMPQLKEGHFHISTTNNISNRLLDFKVTNQGKGVMFNIKPIGTVNPGSSYTVTASIVMEGYSLFTSTKTGSFFQEDH